MSAIDRAAMDRTGIATMPRKMMLPTGRTAELRNLRFDDAMNCWTVRCGCCGEDLPADDEFYSPDGRLPSAWCKACRSEKKKHGKQPIECSGPVTRAAGTNC